jgi:hypothetical protein
MLLKWDIEWDAALNTNLIDCEMIRIVNEVQ